MQIVHITRQYHPSIGGIQTAVAKLCHYLQIDGYDVNVVALNRQFAAKFVNERLVKDEVVDGIPVHRIPFWGPRQYAIAPRVLDQVRECNLIHLHSSDFFLDYLCVTKLLHKKPIVLNSHGIFFHTPVASGFKKIYFNIVTRMNLRKVDAIICDSQHDYDLLKKIAPVEKLNVIPNGVEFTSLVLFDAMDRDPNLILSVGRLAENKGYDRLLTTFALVNENVPESKLVIIGPDLGMLGTLQNLCRDLGISDRVSLIGEVSNTTLESYLKKASVWLSGTYYESFGIALLEAMAAGCIPVIQRIPAFEQLIGRNYEFFSNFDHTEQTAQKIINALSLPFEERKRLIDEGRDIATKYSWKSITKLVENIYHRVL